MYCPLLRVFVHFSIALMDNGSINVSRSTIDLLTFDIPPQILFVAQLLHAPPFVK